MLPLQSGRSMVRAPRSPRSPHDHQSLWRPRRRPARRRPRHPAPRARPGRRADRHRLLRRLPFRPAHRAFGMAGHPVSVRAGPRDRRPCQRGRQRRQRLQGRRYRRRRMPGRQLPPLRVLQRRAGAVLHERLRRHLQRANRGRPGPHAGRLCAADRGGAALRAEGPPSGRPAGRGGAAAVRGHHHLFAAAPLASRAGQEGRHRRHRRAWPHGHQDRACDGRARGRVHHQRIQAR